MSTAKVKAFVKSGVEQRGAFAVPAEAYPTGWIDMVEKYRRQRIEATVPAYPEHCPIYAPQGVSYMIGGPCPLRRGRRDRWVRAIIEWEDAEEARARRDYTTRVRALPREEPPAKKRKPSKLALENERLREENTRLKERLRHYETEEA